MKTILLLGEADQFADSNHNNLVRLGHGVVRARNASEALELYDRQKVDAVLINLAGSDRAGLDLITELHQAHPAMQIIAMAGGGLNDPQLFLSVAHHFGAMQVLAKPISEESLNTAVAVCLAKP